MQIYDLRVRTYMEFLEKSTRTYLVERLGESQAISLLKSIETNTIRYINQMEEKHGCCIQLALLTEDEFSTMKKFKAD